MPRLLRRLLAAAAILSLPPLLATAALWARTHAASDELTWDTPRLRCQATTFKGGLWLFRSDPTARPWSAAADSALPAPPSPTPFAAPRHAATRPVDAPASLSPGPGYPFRAWSLPGLSYCDLRGLVYARPGDDVIADTFALRLALPAAVFAVAPAAWTIGLVRRRRAAARVAARRAGGLCPTCGYDLRAAPPDAAGRRRCPECGQTPASTPDAPAVILQAPSRER